MSAKEIKMLVAIGAIEGQKSVDINFEDEIKALILMSSLPESWDTVVAAISSFRGSEKLKFDEIRDVVLSESIRKREVGDSLGSALSVGTVEKKGTFGRTVQSQRRNRIRNLEMTMIL